MNKGRAQSLSQPEPTVYAIGLSEEQLLELFSEVGSVTLKKIPFSRFRSNAGGQGGTVIEYLFHIKR